MTVQEYEKKRTDCIKAQNSDPPLMKVAQQLPEAPVWHLVRVLPATADRGDFILEEPEHPAQRFQVPLVAIVGLVCVSEEEDRPLGKSHPSWA